MDTSGKIVYARNNEILTANVSNVGAEGESLRPLSMQSLTINVGEAIEDGQRLVVPLRDLGTTEVYPQSLQHSPNGR